MIVLSVTMSTNTPLRPGPDDRQTPSRLSPSGMPLGRAWTVSSSWAGATIGNSRQRIAAPIPSVHVMPRCYTRAPGGAVVAATLQAPPLGALPAQLRLQRAQERAVGVLEDPDACARQLQLDLVVLFQVICLLAVQHQQR